jgi:NRPS condensation-like uncharacterized protein
LKALFDAPTINGLAQELENILRGSESQPLPPILPVSRDQPLPLSLNQEHLWHLDRMIPGTHFFNMPYVYQLSGTLRLDSLEKALENIVLRHEALRTVFDEVDGVPVQIIIQSPNCSLLVADLRSASRDIVTQKAVAMIMHERAQPFDLRTGPLIRTKLLRLTEEQSFLLVTMHHIVSDQWSMQVFRNELSMFYQSPCRSERPARPDALIQLADYAFWEKRLLAQGFFTPQLDYWRKQLAQPLPERDLWKNQSQTGAAQFRSSQQPVGLEHELFEAIKIFARQENCTSFMVILTALCILMYLETGDRETRIGVLFANRNRPEADGVIGHLSNTVVLRIKLAEEMTISETLRRVRDLMLAAFANGEIPFEYLAEKFDRDQSTKRSSLFSVMVIYQRVVDQISELPGLVIAPFEVDQSAISETTLTKCKLVFKFRESSTKLTGFVNYGMDTFGVPEITMMQQGLTTILRSMFSQTSMKIRNVMGSSRPAS